MQQPGQMFPVTPSFPATNITTEQIQKYLDENKKLILAILDNQNLGKLAECAQYQAQLQKNLMYLAAIADAQPQTPAMPTQMAPHPAIPQVGLYMQHPLAAAPIPQQQQQQQPGIGIFPPRGQPFNNPHALQGQMGMGSVGPNNINPLQNDTNIGGGSASIVTSSLGLNDSRVGNKQDKPDGGSDEQGNSGTVHGSREGEQGK